MKQCNDVSHDQNFINCVLIDAMETFASCLRTGNVLIMKCHLTVNLSRSLDIIVPTFQLSEVA